MRLFRRKPKPPGVDYLAAIREAGQLRDRITSIRREAQIAAGMLDMERLWELHAEADRAHERMREIAREIGAIA